MNSHKRNDCQMTEVHTKFDLTEAPDPTWQYQLGAAR